MLDELLRKFYQLGLGYFNIESLINDTVLVINTSSDGKQNNVNEKITLINEFIQHHKDYKGVKLRFG